MTETPQTHIAMISDLPLELVLTTLALSTPSSRLPANTRFLSTAFRSNAGGTGFLQRAWRNRVLLGGGSAEVDDWFTKEVNDTTFDLAGCMHLVGTHLSLMLRSMLPGSGKPIGSSYADSAAPPSTAPPPGNHIMSPDYVAYLFSANGPLIGRFATTTESIQAELDTVWGRRFAWCSKPRVGFYDFYDDEGNALFPTTAFEVPKVAHSPQWWQPMPDLLHLVLFFIRSGQLELLSIALAQLTKYIPALVNVSAHPSRWAMLCLDNRRQVRSIFAQYASKKNPPFSFSFKDILCIFAVLEWSLPTLQVILRSLSMDLTPAIATWSPLLCWWLRASLPYVSDTGRVFAMLDCLLANNIDIPMQFSFAHHAHREADATYFKRLLFEYDLPRLDLQNALDARQVATAVKFRITHCHQGVSLIPMAVEHGFLDLQAWGYILCHSAGATPPSLELLAAACEVLSLDDQRTALRFAMVSAAKLENATLNSLIHLMRTSLNVDPIDLLVQHAADIKRWDMQRVLQADFGRLPPSYLPQAINGYLACFPDGDLGYSQTVAAHNRSLILCRVFSTYMPQSRLSPLASYFPAVIKDQLTGEQLATLIAAHVHVEQLLCQSSSFSSQCSTLVSALNALQAAWRYCSPKRPGTYHRAGAFSLAPRALGHAAYKDVPTPVPALLTFISGRRFHTDDESLQCMMQMLAMTDHEFFVLVLTREQVEVSDELTKQLGPTCLSSARVARLLVEAMGVPGDGSANVELGSELREMAKTASRSEVADVARRAAQVIHGVQVNEQALDRVLWDLFRS